MKNFLATALCTAALGLLLLHPRAAGGKTAQTGRFVQKDLIVSNYRDWSYKVATKVAPGHLIAIGAPKVLAQLIKERTTIEASRLEGDLDEKRGQLLVGKLSGGVIVTVRRADKAGSDYLTHLRASSVTYQDTAGGADTFSASMDTLGSTVVRSQYAPDQQDVTLRGGAGHFEFDGPAGRQATELKAADLNGPIHMKYQGRASKSGTDPAPMQSLTAVAGHMKLSRLGENYVLELSGGVTLDSESFGHAESSTIRITLTSGWNVVDVGSGSMATITLNPAAFRQAKNGAVSPRPGSGAASPR